MVQEITFTEIEKHPLRNCYMLFAKGISLPPYFGTKNECLKAQTYLEDKLHKEFIKLSENEQIEYINQYCKSNKKIL